MNLAAGTVFEKLFGASQHANDMGDDPFAVKAKTAADRFTDMVKFLKNPVTTPVTSLRTLGHLIWDMVHYRITHTAMFSGINAMHFYGELAGQKRNPAFSHIPAPNGKFTIFLLPENWLEMVDQDAIMQLGGLIFCGSQARDFYNEKYGDLAAKTGETHSPAVRRAAAFEAEWLMYCRGIQETSKAEWHPNDYQKSIMADYPKGLASLPPELWYESKPFEIPVRGG